MMKRYCYVHISGTSVSLYSCTEVLSRNRANVTLETCNPGLP